jgi:capsular exopolysaccharide synthesis family protein
MLVSYNEPLSRGAEAYRSLRNAVLLASIDRPYKTMLVTSTLPGEGKSNTASNYAVVLAQRGARVLVIDADLRRPTLHKGFNIANGTGLSNLILSEVTSEPFAQPLPELQNLQVITAGKKVPLPSEALSSARFYSLLKKWESDFDFVVIDSAPLLVVSDSLPLASWVDTIILVTRYNVTPIRALKRTQAILNRTNANVAGVVLNDVSDVGAKYGGYDYGYGDYYN